MAEITICGMAGSLRKESYNRAALLAAQRLTPPGVRIVTFDGLAEIPPFNQDHEKTPAPAVRELKRMVRECDAVLFSTPEYNYSIPGVLKNAIDWASRPYGDSAWAGKPVALMSAAIGMLGGARAQYHLRQSFVFLDMHALNAPEVMIPFAADKFDENGQLRDETTAGFIRDLLVRLGEWTRLLQEGERVAVADAAG